MPPRISIASPQTFRASRVARNFKVGEVAADAAYLSRENMNLVGDAGGMPYICFKNNSTGQSK